MIDIGDGPGAEWVRAHFDFPHRDWCLIWPFSRNQTGYALIGKDNIRVHRIMCEHRHGPAPTPEHHAAHSCDRGHEGCVNPWHLDWKTPSENQYDRFKDGIPKPRWKLTPEQAREIRDLKGLERVQDTAARYQINESNVRLIQAGKTWRLDRERPRAFTREEVALIRATPYEKSARQWAEQFGVGRGTIERIRAGQAYRHLLPSDHRA